VPHTGIIVSFVGLLIINAHAHPNSRSRFQLTCDEMQQLVSGKAKQKLLKKLDDIGGDPRGGSAAADVDVVWYMVTDVTDGGVFALMDDDGNELDGIGIAGVDAAAYDLRSRIEAAPDDVRVRLNKDNTGIVDVAAADDFL
jgi:hypothetical protein